jgi:O-glycosyl hydrolase
MEDLSYKWYKNTTFSTTGSELIEGETGKNYTPTLGAAGDTFYYVVVTNTDTTKEIPTSDRTSNIARIRVTSEAAATAAATFTVNTDTKNQYIRGFGGMSSVWTSPALTLDEVDTMFNPDGFGYNIFRICLYPYMDDLFNGTEPAPENAPDAHKNYYRMVRQAKRHGALILASPWTPPGEWKSNNSRMAGGHLEKEYYGHYAKHMQDYIARMAQNGAAIDYISTQNEPDIIVSYDGCEWTGEEMRDFLMDYGLYITQNSTVKLMPGESYQFLDSYYNPIYNNESAREAVGLIGGHIYGGGLRRHTRAINAGKEVWMTEHLFNTSSNYAIDPQWQSVWAVVKEVHDCMVNDFNAYIWWYSKRFYSLIGDGEYGTAESRPLFRGYALSHYAKYATGKNRVAVTASGVSVNGATSNVFVTAYESDDEVTLVFFNRHGSNNVGQLDIKIPFEAKGASMVITQGGGNTQVDTTAEGVKVMAPDIIVLSADGKTGTLDLPASSIISVRFTK